MAFGADIGSLGRHKVQAGVSWGINRLADSRIVESVVYWKSGMVTAWITSDSGYGRNWYVNAFEGDKGRNGGGRRLVFPCQCLLSESGRDKPSFSGKSGDLLHMGIIIGTKREEESNNSIFDVRMAGRNMDFILIG